MPMYNLLDYSDNYSKTSRSLQNYYRVEPVLDDNYDILNLFDNNITD